MKQCAGVELVMELQVEEGGPVQARRADMASGRRLLSSRCHQLWRLDLVCDFINYKE